VREAVEALLGQFPLGDVVESGNAVRDLSRLIDDLAHRQPLQVDRATLSAVPDLARPTAVNRDLVLHVVEERRRVAARREKAWVLTECLGLAVATDSAEGPVHLGDSAIGISDHESLTALLEQLAGQPQLCLDMAARSHVAHHTDGLRWPAPCRSSTGITDSSFQNDLPSLQ